MNKTALAIQMLELLYSRGKLNRNELASLLEVTPRKIIDLKQELEIAGYEIESTAGKYGGYNLKKDYFLPVFPLTDFQKSVLAIANDYLKNSSDFLYPEEFQKIIDKIKVVTNVPKLDRPIIYYSKNTLEKTISNTISILETAILENRQVSLEYLSIKAKKPQTYIIEPYWIINWQNAYYLIGYEVNKQAFRMFKLVKQRLKKVEVLNKHFYKLDYALKDIMGEVALIKDKIIQVEFKVTGYAARLVEEKEIGIHSEKIWNSNDELCVTCEVEGTIEIEKLILSLGADAMIVKPEFLKEKIKNEIKKMNELYKK